MNTLPPPQKKSGFSDSEVMSQVQKERGEPKRMEVLDILEKSSQGQIEPQKLYNALAYASENDPKLRVIRANNSLFIIYNLGQGNAEVMMETADKPKALVDSVKQFFESMRKAGFKSVQLGVGNPEIIRVIKMGGFEPKLSSVGGQQMSAVVEL